MKTTQKIRLDFAQRGITPRIDAVQGDSYSRVVEAALYENGVAWTVPEGVSVLVRYRRPDGTGDMYETLPDGSGAVSASDNVLTVTLSPQMLAVAGLVTAQLQITRDDACLATFSFGIMVDRDPSAGVPESREAVSWANWTEAELTRIVEEAKENGEFAGPPGDTPYIGDNGNWWIGETDTGVQAQGSQVELDATLTQSGMAADAKVVGDALGGITNPVQGNSLPGQRIALDDAMHVGAVYKSGKIDTAKTEYMYTNLIPLNETKSFQVVAVNALGKTRHIELRYVTAYDADGNCISTYSLEGIAMATPSEGRIIQMDEAVSGVVITIYKATDYTFKTVILPSAEGEDTPGIELNTDKLSGFSATLEADEFCYGNYNNGLADYTDIYSICTKGYIKPFVKSAELLADDYAAVVSVYKNGAYIESTALLLAGAVYNFDHRSYQYRLSITSVDHTRLFDFNAPREAILVTVSAPDVLRAYNEMQSARDTAHERTNKALECLMRRNYDVSYANAPAPIDLITYVGNNQIVHPKVLYFPDGFGGHRFWMAYTPYPWNWDIYENPSIAFSDDGYQWTNIDANPLDDPGGVGINTDTHLVYVEDTGTLELWWRYVNTTLEVAPEILYRMTSTDGVNWTTKEVVNNNDSGDHVRYLSPSVLHDGSKYRIWVVNSTDNTIDYYEAENGSEVIPEESIALDDKMMVGKVLQNGKLDETATGYMYTPMITLNATKSFRLTATNVNGAVTNPALRYVTAYDADGNVLTDYSLQNVALASGSEDRIVTMDNAVAAVVITIASASDYTDKTITLIGAEVTGLGTLELKNSITLDYQADGTTYTLWHIDVIEDNGQLVLLAMCKNNTVGEWPLFLSASEDNEIYTTPELIMKGNPYGWDQLLYRSSIVNVDGEYRIYYSALEPTYKKHGLGVCTSKTLSNFVGKW